MRLWWWMVPAVLGACAGPATSDDVVRDAMAQEGRSIDSLIQRIDASVGAALQDEAVVFADAAPLAIDRSPPAPLDPRVQGTVSVRALLDWSSAFMATDGPHLLASEGRSAVAAQARSLSQTLRRAAAAPQPAGLDRAIIAFDLQVVASQLGRISCLARAFDATDRDAQLQCSLAEHLDILVAGSSGLEAALARSSSSLGDAQPALMAIEAAAGSALAAAQQAQAPSATVALINNCLVNARTLEMDDAAAAQAASKLWSSQQVASLAMSTALLGDDTYANVVLLAHLDALQQMLDGLRADDMKSGTDAGVSCADAQGFDCIAEKLTDGMLQLDAMHSANESSTCAGAATEAMAPDLAAAQHAFDLVHPNPRTFVDSRDYSAIVLEHHVRWSLAMSDVFDAK